MGATSIESVYSTYSNAQGDTHPTGTYAVGIKRDVSEIIDEWYHKQTPFLNRLAWGPDSGAIAVEWLYEHGGFGYIILSGELIATGNTNIIATSNTGATANAVLLVQSGAMVMGWSSAGATHAVFLVTDISVTGDITLTPLDGNGDGTVDAGTRLYIVGNFANEASVPRMDISRIRNVLTNTFAILRKDIQISGSMMATDMYGVAEGELRRQTRLRLLEMQREREMAILFSAGARTSATARTSSANPIMRGVYSFINSETDTALLDTSTTSLTESTFNNLVIAAYENGCTPNVVVGSAYQLQKFTEWDVARVRTTPDAKLGGHFVSRYLTKVGVELELLPMIQFPQRFLFVLDTSKITPIAKRGRKAIFEELGQEGDYRRWQMISEFTVKCGGTAINQLGGCFDRLTPVTTGA